MPINQTTVCEMLRNIRSMPSDILYPINFHFDVVYATVLLKCAHHIEEKGELPTLSQIRRWQLAAIKTSS